MIELILGAMPFLLFQARFFVGVVVVLFVLAWIIACAFDILKNL